MTHTLAGARATIDDPEAILKKAQGWAAARNADLLLADARMVFGKDHLESAALHAERSFEATSMAARSVAMEALTYLAGQRQVSDAIRLAGLRKGTERVALIVFGPPPPDELLQELGWSREDTVLDAEGKDLGTLGITSVERGTLPEDREVDLALEKTALVDILK